MSTKDIVLAGKYIKINGITWSTTSSLSQSRYGLAGCGIMTATLAFGGSGLIYDEESETFLEYSNYTESFNGTNWSTTGAMNTGRKYLAGCGTATATLSFGGDSSISPNPTLYSSSTESFNGTSWSVLSNLNSSRGELSGIGISNAALAFGGTTGTISGTTEKFNGSIWSTTGSMNTSRTGLSGSGLQSSAMSFGGYTDSYSSITEKFDGSTWAISTSLNISRKYCASCGTRIATTVFGGENGSGSSSSTEMFDGLSWTNDSLFVLNTARHSLAGSGVSNYALSFGGYISNRTNITEKFVESYPYKGSSVVASEFVLKFVTSMRAFTVTSTGTYYNLILDRTALSTFQSACYAAILTNNYTNLSTICLTFLKSYKFKRGISTESLSFSSTAESIFINACSSYIGKNWDSFIEDFFIELFLLLITGSAGSFILNY